MNRDRAFALLDEVGLDAVVATSAPNLTYLSGVYVYTQRTLPGRMSAILLTRDADATYLFCAIDESLIRDRTWIRDLRTYREFVEDPAERLTDLLHEKKLEGKRIGVERRSLSAARLEQIEAGAPKALYLDSLEYFKRLRMVKTPEEVERLGLGASVTRKAIEAAFTAARPGDTEKRVANNIVHHMFQAGCDETAFITVATGLNGSRAHHLPDQTRLEAGQIVRTDLGGCFDGYYSDVGRTHVVGEPTREQSETYRRLHAAYREVIDRITVGRPLRELYETCRRGFTQRGLDFFMHHIGHSLGVEIHEPPMIEPTEEAALQENMAFNVELYHRDRAGQGYFVEDLVLVTTGGPQVLTGRLAPPDIPVIA